MTQFSKPLTHSDSSGAEFVIELLDGDQTSAINFDRLQKDGHGGYVIVEFLLCEESQRHVTPHSSHPRFYWDKNSRKFISLWKAAQKLEARLLLVNYAKKGTAHENEVKLMEVTSCTESGINTEERSMTRDEFKSYFRNLNKEGLQ